MVVVRPTVKRFTDSLDRAGPVTVTNAEAVAVKPSRSVAVTVARWRPARMNACVTDAPAVVAPSSNAQRNETASPGDGSEPVAVNLAARPPATVDGPTTAATMGPCGTNSNAPTSLIAASPA